MGGVGAMLGNDARDALRVLSLLVTGPSAKADQCSGFPPRYAGYALVGHWNPPEVHFKMLRMFLLFMNTPVKCCCSYATCLMFLMTHCIYACKATSIASITQRSSRSRSSIKLRP